jgi:hypothetical protein
MQRFCVGACGAWCADDKAAPIIVKVESISLVCFTYRQNAGTNPYSNGLCDVHVFPQEGSLPEVRCLSFEPGAA